MSEDGRDREAARAAHLIAEKLPGLSHIEGEAVARAIIIDAMERAEDPDVAQARYAEDARVARIKTRGTKLDAPEPEAKSPKKK